MLARRLPTIMPPMSLDEALEVTAVHSVAGLLSAERGVLASRPFRAPHHTVSAAGLVGGGDPVRPGEVSLAHRGLPLPRRAAGVQGRGAGVAPAAAGGRLRHHLPGAGARHLPGAAAARRRHQPLPLRLCRRAIRPLHLRARARACLPRSALGAAARSHRSARGAAAGRRGAPAERRRAASLRRRCATRVARGARRRRPTRAARPSAARRPTRSSVRATWSGWPRPTPRARGCSPRRWRSSASRRGRTARCCGSRAPSPISTDSDAVRAPHVAEAVQARLLDRDPLAPPRAAAAP